MIPISELSTSFVTTTGSSINESKAKRVKMSSSSVTAFTVVLLMAACCPTFVPAITVVKAPSPPSSSSSSPSPPPPPQRPSSPSSTLKYLPQTVVHRRCLDASLLGSKRYIFDENDNILQLFIERSNRVTHRIFSEMFRIYVQESLGYQNVTMIESMGNVINFPAPARFFDRRGIDKDEPRVMVNLEFWQTADMDFDGVVLMNYDVSNYGSLAEPARYAWLMPRQLGRVFAAADKTAPISETVSDILWTVFLKEDTARAFDIDLPDDIKLIEAAADIKTSNSSYDDMGCPEAVCRERGVFVPPQCKVKDGKSSACALLLARDFNETAFVIDDIHELHLLVKVVWLGDAFNRTLNTLTERYAQRARANKSIVFLAMTHSDLVVDESAFYSVLFPHCERSDERITKKNGCKYDLMRPVKLASSELSRLAEPIHETLNLFSFDMGIQRALLYAFAHSLTETNDWKLSADKVACDWMRRHPMRASEFDEHDKISIAVGAIFPFTLPMYMSRSLYRAAHMAITAVNNDPNVLPQAKLELLAYDGQCKPSVVLKRFIDFMRPTLYDKMLGVLGPAFSDSVEPIASLATVYRMLVISYGAEGGNYSDRKRYRNFFRTIGENRHHVRVLIDFFKAMGWKRMAALNEDGHKYTEYLTELYDAAEREDIQFVVNRKMASSDDTEAVVRALIDLKTKYARAIIADMNEKTARQVMCEAYHLNMTAGNGFTWFLPDWLSGNWYDTDLNNKRFGEVIRCNTSTMIDAINGYFSIAYQMYAPDDAIMQENITIREWKAKFAKLIVADNVTDPDLVKYGGYVYDAVWVFAYAAEKLVRQMPEALSNLHSPKTMATLRKFVQETDFEGVSGHMKFYGGSSRVNAMHVNQFIDGRLASVASYLATEINEASQQIVNGRLDLFTDRIVWFTATDKDGAIQL